MSFKMPFGEDLKIECSDPDLDAEINQKIEGVFYKLSWENKNCYWFCKTRHEAYSVAIGIQWGAFQMMEKLGEKS